MTNEVDITANIEAMERLRRNLGQPKEVSVVTSAGDGISAWVIKVKSHLSYNIYSVAAVLIGQVGSNPVELGQQVEAFNLGEDFDQQGGSAVGGYAVMFKVGQKRLFYCPV